MRQTCHGNLKLTEQALPQDCNRDTVSLVKLHPHTHSVIFYVKPAAELKMSMDKPHVHSSSMVLVRCSDKLIKCAHAEQITSADTAHEVTTAEACRATLNIFSLCTKS